MYCFLEFVDRKERESRKHLKLVEKALKNAGLKVENYIDQDDSYLFVNTTNPDTPFEGVRVYEIGNSLAYRIQKEKETEPYGKAYLLDLEEMFHDFMSENMKEEKAGKKVIDSLVNEIKQFFDRSAKAESEILGKERDKTVILKTGGTDYSGMVVSKI
jgi:hypothetical protein